MHFLNKPFEIHRTLAEIELQSDWEYTYSSEFTGAGEKYALSDLNNKDHKGLWAVFQTNFQGNKVAGTIKDLRTSYSSEYSIQLEEHQGWQPNYGHIKLYRSEEEAIADDN